MRGAVHIGPYRLRRAIATTATSTVWVATHGPSQRTVALKTLSVEASTSQTLRKNFRIGLRRLADLANPNVLHLYDAGSVDSVAASASGGDLQEGMPYLVTELCSGGSLDEIKRPFRWAELKAILVALLDGLAHIHSRGVVHGALSPNCILLNGPRDERTGIKLGGFRRGTRVDGAVFAEDWSALGESLHYMAPEQLERRWRDVGPTADLYALGCLTWHLASNRRPFRGLRGSQLVEAHRDRSMPTLVPEGPVPEGLEAWIDRLTRKSPDRRFVRAADAAWELIRLGDVARDLPVTHADALVVALDDGPRTFVQHESGQFDLNAIRRELQEQEPDVTFSTEPELTEAELTVFDGTLSPDVPPVPVTWQEKGEYRADRPRGAGLGVFDLLRRPMLDREVERTLLWEGFRDVVTTRSARLVVLSGRAGIGKTHVARWLCERAHELGAATVLRASHTRSEAPGTSVRRMFTAHLRSGRLDRKGVFERVKSYLFERGVRQIDEVEALTELIAPDTSKDVAQRRVAGVEERHATVRRFFRLLTLERPLIVWLEDAHWGNDALGLAYSVMETQRFSPMPVLFLLTPRDETLAERPVERALIEELLKLDGSQEIPVGPLPRPYQLDLLQRVLGLEESLAEQVSERTSGNPQLAIEVVGDWVQRGVLDATVHGLELASGEDLVLPDDLHAVWMRRVERVLRGLPEAASSFLEAAAVLGLEVDEEEWAQITDHPDGFHFPYYLEKGGKAFFPQHARIRAKLADRLMDFRLAEETDTGWAFSHGMIRESLIRWARDTGRFEQHHRAAAAMLRVKMKVTGKPLWERLGDHLHAAGELEEALEPLMRGVAERRSSVGVKPALALLAICQDTMERLGLASDDPRWGQLWIARAQLEFIRGEYAASERWARQAALTASEHEWDAWHEVLQEAVFRQAEIALRRSELAGAEQLLKQLEASVSADGDPNLYAKAMHGLARVSRARGKADQALAYFAEARRYFERANNQVGVADAWKAMADLDLRSGELDGAANLYRRALEVYETEEERRSMAACLNGLAEVARHRGDVGEAELGYRHALHIFESAGSAQAVVPRLNLGLLHLKRADYTEAEREGQRALERLERSGRPREIGTTHIVLLASSAGRRDWDAFDAHLQAASDAVRKLGLHEVDLAWCAHKAGDLALHGEQRERARAAYRFAWYQYRALEDDRGMRRIEAVIGPSEDWA